MAPRSPIRRVLSWLVVPLTASLAVTLLQAAPAQAANPVTPGNFTGRGFDQCNTPSQAAMSAWRRSSPFRAVGIYISGNSRACKAQPNLTPTWVKNQLAAGWKLMPITLGPQASCATRFPRYGASIDPTINPSNANAYGAARKQGTDEATKAVAAATRLGIVRGSTIFYDLEAFNTGNYACKMSALWFTHAWTVRLHALGYASGFYSSAASGIKMLDDQRVTPRQTLTLPDQMWIADWDGRMNTSSTFVRSDGWVPGGRAKQYRGGHNETHGGVTINIDSNWLDLRTPRIPGSATAPSTSPSTTDPKCTVASMNRTAYRWTSAYSGTERTVPLQCLLKQQRIYPVAVTGKWNSHTSAGVRNFQNRIGHPLRYAVTRSDWTALLSAGNYGTVLKPGVRSSDVIRVQRALNAAGDFNLPVTGVYDARTATAVGAYQRTVGISATKVVASLTWSALEAGRR